MIIYEVNLEVDEDIDYKMAGWLPEHIQKLLSFSGFKSAYWYFRTPEDEGLVEAGKTLWTIHYVIESRQHLDAYLNGPAEQVRAEALEKFGDKFRATRRILNLLAMAGPEQGESAVEAPQPTG